MSDEYLGCTDGGCVFGHPGGMATNGGCDCLSSMKDHYQRIKVREAMRRYRDKITLLTAEAGALASQLLDVQRDCIAATSKLEEQLRRSATVCPKDGCMLWKGHSQKHATKDQVEEALAANSHPMRKK